jgi:hypothetical protein
VQLLRPTLGDDKWSNTTAGMLEKAIEFIRDEEEKLGEDGERPAAVGRMCPPYMVSFKSVLSMWSMEWHLARVPVLVHTDVDKAD